MAQAYLSTIKSCVLAFLLAVPTAALAGQPDVRVNAGQLEYRSSSGDVTVIATGSEYLSPALSPNGRTVAYIRALKPENPDREGVAELWIADGPSGKTRRLIGSRVSSDPKANMQWFDRPIFSIDGKSIYVSALAWGDENAVHKVDAQTGKERFITGGDIDSVMRSGPYRGDLLVARHTPWPLPKTGYHYPLYVVRPDGKLRFRVPDMDSDDSRIHVVKWLTAHGWTAW